MLQPLYWSTAKGGLHWSHLLAAVVHLLHWKAVQGIHDAVAVFVYVALGHWGTQLLEIRYVLFVQLIQELAVDEQDWQFYGHL